MTTLEALKKVLSQMEFGQCRALLKEDIKYRVYELMGHYPRQVEFDKAFESVRKPTNIYGLVYLNNVGWYRPINQVGISQYKQRLGAHIDNVNGYREAL